MEEPTDQHGSCDQQDDHRLEDQDHIDRNALGLHGVATGFKGTEEDTCTQSAQRLIAAQESNGDGIKTNGACDIP